MFRTGRHLFFISVLILFHGLISFAGVDQEKGNPEFSVIISTDFETQISVHIPGVEVTEIEKGDRTYQQIRIPRAGWTTEVGRPELPVIAGFVAIAPGASVNVMLERSDYSTLKDIHVLPHQECETWEVGTNALIMDRVFYDRDSLYPEQIVEAGSSISIRDLHVVPLIIRPVQYNPVRKEVRVYRDLQVVLTCQGGDSPDSRAARSEAFEKVYGSIVLNDESLFSSQEVQRGGYLIVTPDRWSEALQPLVRWKRQKGHQTEVVNLSQIGSTPTSDQIRQYIQDYYDHSPVPLEYVLLVGDANWLPTFFYEDEMEYRGWDAADHPYSMLAGDDYFPDVFVGRLAVSSVSRLRTVVNKIVSYERDPYMGQTDWYRKALMVCNYGGNTSARTTKLWVRDKLLQNGFSRVDTSFIYDIYECDVDFIEATINSGVSFVNYRGWLGWGGWADEANARNILKLQNGFMLPVVTDMVCAAAAFYDDCPAEAWLRAGTVLSPRGAIAVIGPTAMNTKVYFNNVLDCGLYAAIFDDSLSTLGQALARAKMELYLQYPLNRGPGHAWNSVECYFYMYTLIGDPGLEIWTDVPRPLAVEHPLAVDAGSHGLTCVVRESDLRPLRGAYVCLFGKEQIHSGGFTGLDGTVYLPLSVEAGDSVMLTVTRHNFIPYQVVLVTEEMPMCVALAEHTVDDDELDDSSGDGDGTVNPGERIEVALSLQNMGTTATASGVKATIVTRDPYVSLLKDSLEFGSLLPGQSAWSPEPLVLDVAPHCPHGRVLDLMVEISDDDGGLWYDLCALPVSAPDFSLQHLLIEDDDQGDSNGHIDPGETLRLTVTLKNEGGKGGDHVRATLRTTDQTITLIDSTAALGSVPVGGQVNNGQSPFLFSVGFMAFNGHRIPLTLWLESRSGMMDTCMLSLSVGMVSDGDPAGPDAYGYYAFDSGDERYYDRPEYVWTEIDPRYGGPGTVLGLIDRPIEMGDTREVPLPFPFRYYGQSYDHISVCSNGWLSLGSTRLSNFRNWSIPSVMNPPSLIAPFGDDLYLSSGRVSYHYDEPGHQFIVEWNRMRNAYNSTTETFQAILCDPAHSSTITGDGEIVFQYRTIANVDNAWNFATVGIESPDKKSGLEYTYAGQYTPGARMLTDGLAIKFTTGGHLPEHPYLILFGTLIDDDGVGGSMGDGDGLVDAGERIELTLEVLNYGLQTARDVTAVLSSTDPRIQIAAPLRTFPDIGPGEMVPSDEPFVVHIGPDCENGQSIDFTAETNLADSLCSEVPFQIEVVAPVLVFRSQSVRVLQGDGDERAEAGETCGLVLAIENNGLGQAAQIEGLLTTEDEVVTILEHTVMFTDAQAGEIATNQAHPFLFSVSHEASYRRAPFTLTISANGNQYQSDIGFEVKIGRAEVLLVDDDGGDNLETYYMDALQVQSRSHERYDRLLEGRLDPLMIDEYDTIVWFTGSERDSTLTPSDQDRLRAFLDRGGSLFLTGQDIGYDLVENGTAEEASFYRDYLHAEYVRDGWKIDILTGMPDEPLIERVSQANILSLAIGGAANQNFPSVILPGDGASPLYKYSYTYYDIAGIKYEDFYRLVYFAFGFEGIGSFTAENHAAVRARLMRNIINWFQYEKIKGDLNKDGVVTIADILRMVDIILKVGPEPNNFELWAADCNDDGQHDARDVVGILNSLVWAKMGTGLQSSF